MTANRKSGRLKEPVRVRTKKLADGSESYYLDIYVDGKRSYEFLKMYHLPEVNAAVREQNRATRAAVETIKSQRIIDITNSKAGIKTKSAWAKLALADWMERFYALQERKGIRKIEKLRSVIKVVNQYGRNTKMGDIDKKWALGFIDWIQRTYKGRTGRPVSQGTVVFYTSQLSIALNAAVRAEWLGENPFMLLSPAERVKKPESKRQFLTIEEMKTLIATDCRSEIVKQAYLFSCYSALRLNDIENLRWKDLVCNDGRYMIATVQQKTSTPIYTPLSRNAIRWLPERKTDNDNALIFAALPSRPTTNKMLGQWVKKAGIDKKITYHTSRHTFGTMMMTVGADLYTTCKLMGHADVRTTQIYAKIVDSKKIEAVGMVDKLFEQRCE
ncbi:site-specific integrase [uncultured Bacteroides sp.]|uniref:site-specific integrase n=1 Tax=uncultured Bacteroides sp. TaxID=162156 RepID=UPI002619C14A|nr:site-specific integrase [uncultured Bacteroides sp.]